MAPFGQVAAASTARSGAGPKAARSPGCRFRLRPSHCGRQLRWVRRARDGALCTPLPVRAPSPHPFASCQIRGRRAAATPPVPLRWQLRPPHLEMSGHRGLALAGSAPHRGDSSPPRPAKRANPRARPSSASLREDSQAQYPQRSPAPIAGRALPEIILSPARRFAPKDRSGTGASTALPLLPISTTPITSLRTCQLKNAKIASHLSTPLRGWPGGPSSLARVPIPSNIAPHLTMCRREAAVAQLDPLHAPDTGMLPFVVSMSI